MTDTHQPAGPRGGRVPDPVDVHVGHRLRLQRTIQGMSQVRLGSELGLTFQQVQKYERGTNRISASRLHDLARILNVDVGFFFADMPDVDTNRSTPDTVKPDDDERAMQKRETLELVRAYYKIPDDGVRKRLFELTKAIAAEPDDAAEDLRASA